ncbi:unnamed protein product [Closterium sp. Naga37s-1]|nr:unnamed protein product [Closterium sp. Naga37s-1]
MLLPASPISDSPALCNLFLELNSPAPCVGAWGGGGWGEGGGEPLPPWEKGGENPPLPEGGGAVEGEGGAASVVGALPLGGGAELGGRAGLMARGGGGDGREGGGEEGGGESLGIGGGESLGFGGGEILGLGGGESFGFGGGEGEGGGGEGGSAGGAAGGGAGGGEEGGGGGGYTGGSAGGGAGGGADGGGGEGSGGGGESTTGGGIGAVSRLVVPAVKQERQKPEKSEQRTVVLMGVTVHVPNGLQATQLPAYLLVCLLPASKLLLLPAVKQERQKPEQSVQRTVVLMGVTVHEPRAGHDHRFKS